VQPCAATRRLTPVRRLWDAQEHERARELAVQQLAQPDGPGAGAFGVHCRQRASDAAHAVPDFEPPFIRLNPPVTPLLDSEVRGNLGAALGAT
jgi:hypothetical protein